MTLRQGIDHAHRGISGNVWVLAAATAFCGHLALAAFAIEQMREPPEESEFGAPGVEVAYEIASPPSPVSDLPPGPESEASAAAVAEQKSEAKEVDLPQETPVESQEPERLVTLQKSDKPPDEDPQIKADTAKPLQESVAQEATAPPPIPTAQPAEKSTTRDQGTGESAQRVRVTWQKELLAHLDKYKRYPAERSQQSADILLTLELDRTGRVLSTSIARSSGDPAFDSAAIAMVERASPVPPPPPLVADEGLSFSLPVIFRKRDR